MGGRAAKRRRLADDVALDDQELGTAVGGRQLRAGKRDRQRLPGRRRREGASQPAKVAPYPAHRRLGAAQPLCAVALDRVGVEHVLDVDRDVLVEAPRGEVGERPHATAHRLEADVEPKDLVDHELADLRPAVLGDPGRYVGADVERHPLSAGHEFALEVVREFPVPGGRLDVVWQWHSDTQCSQT
ncbi:MAG: hypothetical protein M0010_10695 [Actinomycetota bacterium]|nr:hypothetical protein [Actinomycetota bacterium]